MLEWGWERDPDSVLHRFVLRFIRHSDRCWGGSLKEPFAVRVQKSCTFRNHRHLVYLTSWNSWYHTGGDQLKKKKQKRERKSLRTENWSTPTLIGSVYKDEPAKKTQKINEQWGRRKNRRVWPWKRRRCFKDKTAECCKHFLKKDSCLIIGFSKFLLSVILTKLFCRTVWAKACLEKVWRDKKESNLKNEHQQNSQRVLL